MSLEICTKKKFHYKSFGYEYIKLNDCNLANTKKIQFKFEFQMWHFEAHLSESSH